jgi:alkylation response protein AidB-like acyl-CoA dehydrogenase
VLSSASSLRWQALALALVCADMVGTCAAALEGAVAHACEREQFGRPVGSFQAVQQLCADQLVSVEGGRSIMWQAAWAVDELEPAEALALARVAKAYCAEMGRTVCETAIQVWGGLGMTWECPAHRYLRRALLDRQLFGDDRVQLAAIAHDRLGCAAEPGH